MAIVFTQEQVDALTAAIAMGQRVVQLGEKKVEYRSFDEMREALAFMLSTLQTPATRQPRFQVADFSE